MKPISRLFASFSISITIAMLVTGICHGQLSPGDAAPVFSLKDPKGKSYDLLSMNKQPMIILYFLDVESQPSHEGLLSLDNLAKQYKDADLTVWGLTLSPKDKVSAFIEGTNPGIPILLDNAGISDLYQARFVLPTVIIIGPELRILDYFQGGGKTTEVMLVKLAERQLQRKETMLARAISEQVEKTDPGNVKAKMVRGYAAMNEGKLDEAEKVFKGLSQEKGHGAVAGKEGLATLYAKKGDVEKALEAAQEVEKKAPDRAFIHVVKGDLLYGQNKKTEAEKEYQEAIQKEGAESFQKAIAYNRLGRFRADQGNYDKARELYDQAVEIDPYYIEATSNKGITYEKEGKWDKALDSYNKVLALDKADTFAAVLAKKAQEMLDLQKNTEQKKRIDTLVKELAARYRTQKETLSKTEDTWTSRPMVLSFIDFQEKGGLSERDGFSSVMTANLADQLNTSGRVKVVERILLDRLLEELNIGSSELADPETALKLGKVLAAKIIGTGSFYYLPDGTLLSLRLIDVETSALPKVVTRQFSQQVSLESELHQLNREILKTIIQKYPLQGFVVQVTGDQVMINIGSRHGVVPGTKFEVLEEQEPINYRGRLLQSSPKPVALIEVAQVDTDLCYASISKKERSIKTDDKVKEKLEDVVDMEKNNVIK